jgi:dihydroneopterin aldolase/2-amino-4-hydroxy-6-hydroxymethyldihydropteridine diphosphokinase/dihydropteroate synthase
MDQILIKDLTVKGLLGPDHWSRGKSQILIINFAGFRDFKLSDNIQDTVSYSTIAGHIQTFLEGKTAHKTLEATASKLAQDCLNFGFQKVVLKLEKAHALLHAESAGIEITRTAEDIPFLNAYNARNFIECNAPQTEDEVFIRNLSLTCYIGVNAFEKAEKQRVIVTIILLFTPSLNDPKDSVPQKNNYRTVAHKVAEFIEQSKYETLEMMVNDVCNVILFDCEVEKVNVTIEKPSAITFAKSAGVSVTRTRKMLPSVQTISDSQAVAAFIAFGSNQGNRAENVFKALEYLDKSNVSVFDTSFMYESAPMYVLDQPKFLNGVIKVNLT